MNRQRFEHLVYSVGTLHQSEQEVLNQLSREGWELVAVTETSNEDYVHLYLKRPFQPDTQNIRKSESL